MLSSWRGKFSLYVGYVGQIAPCFTGDRHVLSCSPCSTFFLESPVMPMCCVPPHSPQEILYFNGGLFGDFIVVCSLYSTIGIKISYSCTSWCTCTTTVHLCSALDTATTTCRNGLLSSLIVALVYSLVSQAMELFDLYFDFSPIAITLSYY